MPKHTLVRPKPKYNSPEYWQLCKDGKINWDQVTADDQQYQMRRKRSLETCHRYSNHTAVRHAPPRDNGAYIPEMSSRAARDRNLVPMARVLVQRLMEFTYQRNREGRVLRVTVGYMAKALGRSTRSVQRYLRTLSDEGYIRVEVISNMITGMVIGLDIYLLSNLFPRHHKEKWPEQCRTPAMPQLSDTYNPRYIVRQHSRQSWATRCMNAVRKRYETIHKPQAEFDFTEATKENGLIRPFAYF